MARIMFEQELNSSGGLRDGVPDDLLETERGSENRVALLRPTLHTAADGSQAHPVLMVLD